jgi:hypothetical protein
MILKTLDMTEIKTSKESQVSFIEAMLKPSTPSQTDHFSVGTDQYIQKRW